MNTIFDSSETAGKPTVLTISDLNRVVSGLLERSFPLLWVSGEISNLTRAASGHWYFTLKDDGAQVKAVMFRGRNQSLDWQPREGDAVEARVLVSLYQARGEFQLNVEVLRQAGRGSLYEQFLARKDKLAREGWFDAARKRVLPAHPRAIGIISSPQAAALQDVLTALWRRAPQIPVFIYPSPVQGVEAPPQLLRALETANRRAECDVLLLVRGGGSLEDLWAFNDEVLTRAIAQSAIPVVSGVGHETDFTLADFAADLRAPTPTAAAELATQQRTVLQAQLQQLAQRLQGLQRRGVQNAAQRLDYLQRRLPTPQQQLQRQQERLGQWRALLQASMARQLTQRQVQLVQQQQLLTLLNPHNTLERGYSIVRDAAGQVVRSAAQVLPGQSIAITLAQGQLDAEVKAP
ncbi:MAG: exodeoxyribonuclease VII large subunit [Burkholderiaceae bacterium]|nr:MAG: exodeoxyribonuclease VII large subunit [Burkholderiaceae bacterium]